MNRTETVCWLLIIVACLYFMFHLSAYSANL